MLLKSPCPHPPRKPKPLLGVRRTGAPSTGWFLPPMGVSYHHERLSCCLRISANSTPQDSLLFASGTFASINMQIVLTAGVAEYECIFRTISTIFPCLSLQIYFIPCNSCRFICTIIYLTLFFYWQAFRLFPVFAFTKRYSVNKTAEGNSLIHLGEYAGRANF